MNKKLLPLLLAVLMVAGCSPSASSEQSSSLPEAVYSYENPDPDMALITSPSGDVTYADYRLYLDVNEEISRYIARQNVGIAALLERDFAGMGIAVDEDAFSQMAVQNLMMMSIYTPSFAENLEKISDVTGLPQDALNDAMLLGYRLQYLSDLLQEHYYTLAEQNHPAEAVTEATSADPASSSAEAVPEASSADPASSTEASSTDPAAEAEAVRQQAIEDEATAMISEYSNKINERQNLDDESVLITVDGEKIPYTTQHRNFIEYVGTSDRLDAIAFIQEGEMALRELERRGTGIPREEYDTTLAQYISSIKADAQFMEHLTRICTMFGATTDDYFKALERPLWLQYTADVYYNLMTEEYNAIPQDAEDRPESADAYYSAQLDKLLEGSEIVNIAG